MKKLTTYCILLLTLTITAQDDERGDVDTVGFFTVNGSVMNTRFNSTDDLFKGSSEIGYEFGISYYLTNDINYDQFFIRFSLDYSMEKGKSDPIIYQNQEVISNGDFPFLGLGMFGAYRFDPQSKLNPYLGGGFFVQNRLNSIDDALTFTVIETGEEFPVFQPDNPDAAMKYRRDGPSSVLLGFTAETGSFIWLGKNWLTVGLGINYGFFPKKASFERISKSNLYVKLGYELF